MKQSKAADCIPETPSEPVSSLSARIQTQVLEGVPSISKKGLKFRIGTDPIVVTIAADHGTVEPNVAHVKSRNGGEFGGKEILLCDTILVVKNTHNSKLHAVLALVRIGRAADENVEPLSGDALR